MDIPDKAPFPVREGPEFQPTRTSAPARLTDLPTEWESSLPSLFGPSGMSTLPPSFTSTCAVTPTSPIPVLVASTKTPAPAEAPTLSGPADMELILVLAPSSPWTLNWPVLRFSLYFPLEGPMDHSSVSVLQSHFDFTTPGMLKEIWLSQWMSS